MRGYRSAEDMYWFEFHYYLPSEQVVGILLRGKRYKAHKVSPYLYSEWLGVKNRSKLLKEIKAQHDLIPDGSDWCYVCNKNIATIKLTLQDTGGDRKFNWLVCDKCKADRVLSSPEEFTIIEDIHIEKNPSDRNLIMHTPNPDEWYVGAAKLLVDAIFDAPVRSRIIDEQIVALSGLYPGRKIRIYDDNDNFVGVLRTEEIKGLSYVNPNTMYLRIYRTEDKDSVIFQNIVSTNIKKDQLQKIIERGLYLLGSK